MGGTVKRPVIDGGDGFTLGPFRQSQLLVGFGQTGIAHRQVLIQQAAGPEHGHVVVEFNGLVDFLDRFPWPVEIGEGQAFVEVGCGVLGIQLFGIVIDFQRLVKSSDLVKGLTQLDSDKRKPWDPAVWR